MIDLIKKFNSNLGWNAFEAIFYKAILALHQTFLFYYSTKLIYGATSLIFAIIYLTVELVNLGLDLTLAQLSDKLLANKFNFKHYCMPQLIFQTLLLLSLFSFILINHQWLNFKLLPANAYLDFTQYLLLAIIIICESIRKTLRLISQLLFLNKPAALIESALIIIYVGLFWSLILCGYSIDFYTIYLPLLAQSLIGLIFLLLYITPILVKNSPSNLDQEKISHIAIIYIRFKNYCYQTSELIFSSNFLIYIFSWLITLESLAPIKFANYLAVFLKVLLERTFGLTTLAIFIKNKALINSQRVLFNFAQKRLIITLFLLFILFTSSILLNMTNYPYLALVFLSFTLLNNFFIIYEQLLLVYNKILIVFLLNMASIIGFALFSYYSAHVSISSLLLLLALFRLASLLIVRLATKNILNS